MNSANSAKQMGSQYFFCSTEARDEFEASQRALEGSLSMEPEAEVHERRFKASSATAARACPSPGRSSAPDASFLG